MKPLRALLWLLLSLGLAVAPGHAAPSGRLITRTDATADEKLAISRDGRFITMLSTPGEKGSDCVVIDRRTHRTHTIAGSSRLEPLCFSRDGRALWVWGLHLDDAIPELHLKPFDHPFIALYDLRRRRYRKMLSGVPQDEVPDGSALSPSGKTLFFAASDGWVWAFSTSAGRLKWSRCMDEEGDEAVSTQLSPDGSKFLRTYWEDDSGETRRAEIISLRTRRVLGTMHLPLNPKGEGRETFSETRFAPQGNQVAVYRPQTRQWIFFNGRHPQVTWKMASQSTDDEDSYFWQWSPDARLICLSKPNGIEIREARSGRLLQRCAGSKNCSLVFSPDNSRLYSLQANETGFGEYGELWQWRLHPTRRQRRADARYMRASRRRDERFALSSRHIGQSLLQAARRGDAARVKFLLGRGAYVETIDVNSESPLMNAVSGVITEDGPLASSRLETVKILIAHGAKVKENGGFLLACAANSSVALMQLLVNHGAGVNDSAEQYGTATPSLAAGAHLEGVRFLLEHGANANTPDEDGQPPLIAILESHASPEERNVVAPVLRLLIQHGANVNARDKSGNSALSLTQDPAIKALLRRAGAKNTTQP